MKQLKRLISLVLAASLSLALVSCGNNSAGNTSGSAGGSSSKSGDLTPTQQIIQEAQGMTLEELAKKAIEESNVLWRGQLQPRQERPAPVHRVSAVHRPQL